MSEYNQITYVREVEPSAISEPHERKAVLAMQATALFDSDAFEKVNDELIRAASMIDAAPTMTYEDLIFVNPLEEKVYVLSEEPAVAEQEALFYTAHKSIEDTLEETIGALQISEFEIASASLQAASKKFGTFHKQLDTAAFDSFRPCFKGINGFPGPSGLFTAAIPIIDLLSHGGSNISDEEHARLVQDIDRKLYPRHQSKLLKELLMSEGPKVDMPLKPRRSIESLLNGFRKVHTASVRRFVPAALAGEAEGSGGVAEVADYLSSKMIDIRKEREQ